MSGGDGDGSEGLNLLPLSPSPGSRHARRQLAETGDPSDGRTARATERDSERGGSTQLDRSVAGGLHDESDSAPRTSGRRSKGGSKKKRDTGGSIRQVRQASAPVHRVGARAIGGEFWQDGSDNEDEGGDGAAGGGSSAGGSRSRGDKKGRKRPFPSVGGMTSGTVTSDSDDVTSVCSDAICVAAVDRRPRNGSKSSAVTSSSGSSSEWGWDNTSGQMGSGGRAVAEQDGGSASAGSMQQGEGGMKGVGAAVPAAGDTSPKPLVLPVPVVRWLPMYLHLAEHFHFRFARSVSPAAMEQDLAFGLFLQAREVVEGLAGDRMANGPGTHDGD